MAITIVQSAKSANTSPSFTNNTTAGNCLVVCYASYLNTSVPNVTAVKIGGVADNFTFAAAEQITGVGGFEDAGAFIWFDYNCVGGQKAVTVSGTNLTNASGGGSAIYEVSGLMTTLAVLDQTNNQGSTSSSTYSSGSVTTTNPNEIVFGVAIGGTMGAASGFTDQTETSMVAGYKIVTSTGTYTFTGSDTSFYAACIASFMAPVALAPRVYQANQAVMRAAVW